MWVKTSLVLIGLGVFFACTARTEARRDKIRAIVVPPDAKLVQPLNAPSQWKVDAEKGIGATGARLYETDTHLYLVERLDRQSTRARHSNWQYNFLKEAEFISGTWMAGTLVVRVKKQQGELNPQLALNDLPKTVSVYWKGDPDPKGRAKNAARMAGKWNKAPTDKGRGFTFDGQFDLAWNLQFPRKGVKVNVAKPYDTVWIRESVGFSERVDLPVEAAKQVQVANKGLVNPYYSILTGRVVRSTPEAFEKGMSRLYIDALLAMPLHETIR